MEDFLFYKTFDLDLEKWSNTMLRDLNESKASLRSQMLVMRPILSLFSTVGISLLCMLYGLSFMPVIFIGGAITLGFLVFYIRHLMIKSSNKDSSEINELSDKNSSTNNYKGTFKITGEKILLEVNGKTNQELPFMGSKISFVGDHIIRFVHPAYANSLEVMAVIFEEKEMENLARLFKRS